MTQTEAKKAGRAHKAQITQHRTNYPEHLQTQWIETGHGAYLYCFTCHAFMTR